MSSPAEMSPEHPLPPVRWLLGPDILASLRKIALYTFSSGKLDLRDWMQGSIHDDLKDREEAWLDYIADTGDGQLPMLAMARLCLSDVTIEEAPPEVLAGAPSLALPVTLPRGDLLFVGGDTAYHVADKATLDERFCAPFRLAADQLGIDRSDRRPLLGIPGNHDYYDQLDGFNRQFRVPLQGHEGEGPSDELPLDVPGFRRVQSASYMAIQLPHGHWLFGMDTEQDKLDARQSAFFRDILRRSEGPLKVIIAAPNPPIILGKRPLASDAAVVPLLDIDELRPPFVPRRGDPLPARPSPEEIEGASQALSPGELRLYLSGDLHHYERYFGERDEGGGAACCASVVSGGGGAFLQPSHTDFGEVKRHVVYPSPERSREAMAALLRPWVVLKGGYIPVFGGLLSVALYAAAALLRAPWKGLDALLRVALGVRGSGGGAADLGLLRVAAGRAGGVLIIVALLVAAVFAMLSGKSAEAKRAAPRSSPAAAPPAPRRRSAFNGRIAAGWSLLAFAFAIVLAFAWGDNALWIAFPALLVAVTLAAAGVWQSNRMMRAGTHRIAAAAVTLGCVGAAGGLTAAAFSLARPDLDHAQSMVFDFAIGFFLLFMLLGCAVVLPLAGARVHRSAAKSLLFMGFGLYNLALIAAVPFLLTRTLRPIRDAAIDLGVLALSTAVASVVGRRVFLGASSRRWLPLVWLALGAAWIFAPFAGRAPEIVSAPPPWILVAYVALAAALGALITSASFGWYFAVADTWGGHSNEVGGAALVEQYKQFIRIRVTREGLTAFVIAIDDPQIDPSSARGRPRLVDVIELRPKPSARP